MKVWSVSELDNVVAALEPLKGARLQEVRTSPSDVVLGFYTAQRILWLWIDLNSIRPVLLPWTDLPLAVANHKSPLNLFLRAHFSDRVLRDIRRDPSQGRVVHLYFGRQEPDDPELEIRLFPHGRNVIAKANGKQVNWQKPSDLVPAFEETDGRLERALVRSLDQMREQWLLSRQSGKGSKNKSSDPRLRIENEIAKKTKALSKVEEELARKNDMPWRQIGDWLKTHQNLNVPKEWEPFVDRRRKLAWNIEECFNRARDVEAKIFGTEKRLSVLREDLARLKARLKDPKPAWSSSDDRARPQPLKDIEAQGRTLRINEELTAVAGKSAADNMKLLRRARAWDYWFHLRDEPGSHAILFRNKTTRVSDSDLHRVAEWLVRLQFGVKYAQRSGEKVLLVVTECRHVSPIKGDRLGRVTYRNERTLMHSVP